VRYIVEDGRNYLAYTDRKYDLISIELGQTFRPHLASFYTEDFYKQARARLTDDGMVCQFLSLACLGYEQFRGVIQTFLSVFPQTVLWYNRDEFLLIGAVSSPIRLTGKRLELLYSNRRVHDDCALSYWGGASTMLYNPDVYIAGFLCGAESLRNFTKGAPVYHDDKPILEYQSAQNQSNPPYIDSIIPFLSSPKLITAFALHDTSARRIESLRRCNLGDIIASALHRSYDQTGDIRILLEACMYNPQNIKINFALGIEFSKKGKFNEALSYFNAVLEQHPDHEPTHVHLGYMFMQREELDKALYHFLQVLRINPGNVQAYNNIGVLYMQQQRYGDAIAYLEKAYAYEPMNSGIENNLLFCRQQLQQKQ
jgi:spermidine synthase